ncbi:MAG TPA: hypothetical protein VGD68_13855 [Streptosporangiaceae bacterium]
MTAGAAAFAATEREERAELTVSRLTGAGVRIDFRWEALHGLLRVQAERVAGPYQALRLRLRIENHTQPGTTLANREDGLRYALVAAHALIALPGGTFISMTDHPEWAAEVAACRNVGTWPVLAGPAQCRDLVLSSPVILYDHSEIAPESTGDLFDATEIDEILTLRTMALTDEEKREARATDPRAADLIDRLDGLPPEMLERLHGAIRYLEPGAGPAGREPAAAPSGPFPKRSCRTWTGRSTWRSPRWPTPWPTCSAPRAGSCTSHRTNSSRSTPRRGRRKTAERAIRRLAGADCDCAGSSRPDRWRRWCRRGGRSGSSPSGG